MGQSSQRSQLDLVQLRVQLRVLLRVLLLVAATTNAAGGRASAKRPSLVGTRANPSVRVRLVANQAPWTLSWFESPPLCFVRVGLCYQFSIFSFLFLSLISTCKMFLLASPFFTFLSLISTCKMFLLAMPFL